MGKRYLFLLLGEAATKCKGYQTHDVTVLCQGSNSLLVQRKWPHLLSQRLFGWQLLKTEHVPQRKLQFPWACGPPLQH